MQLGSEEEMQQRLASMPVHHSMRGLFFNSVLGVLAYVNEAGGVRAIVEHLGLPPAGERRAPAREPPQAAWC